MILLYFLKKVDIFKGLDDDQLNQISAGCHEKEYRNANRVFAEGENANHVWIVMEGQVDLRFDLPGRPTSEENTIFSITAGNTLGWSGFVPPFQYKLSAYCATRSCKILLINKEFLIDLFEKDNQLGGQARNIYRTASGDSVPEKLNDLINEVQKNKKIHVHLESEITQVEGFVGNFEISVTTVSVTSSTATGATRGSCG